jgi:hypothetical protein
MKNKNMFQQIINPLALTVSVITAVGVLFHDTQMDRAAAVALALPSAVMVYAGADNAIKYTDGHTHAERTSAPSHIAGLRATLPRVQPRDDDRRHLGLKRVDAGNLDATSLWPSV